MRKGFTLIELLIVIGILAILATTVVIVLNPAQLLAEARDAQRIQDMATLTTGLSLFIASVSSPDLDGAGSCTASCFVNLDVDNLASEGCAGTTDGILTGPNGAARHGTKTDAIDADRFVNGTGWVPVNFALISSGAPFGLLPTDPVNTTTYFYSYACDNNTAAKTFEVNANMESNKFQSGGSNDVESDNEDGGNVGTIYEKGSSLTL